MSEGSVQKKSKYGEGSLTLKPGTEDVYRLRVPSGLNANGKRATKQVTFKGTEMAAKRRLAKLLTDTEAGKVTAGRCTVSQLHEKLLANKKARGRAPKTLEEYERMVQWVNGHWGDRQLSSITPAAVDDLIDVVIAEKGRSAAVHYYQFIRTALRQAVRWDLLLVSPTDKTEAPPEPEPATVTPTPAMVRALIEAAEHGGGKYQGNVDLAAMIFIAATTQLGPGELCGLRIEDLDFERAQLAVKRSISKTKGSLQERPTKTKARTSAIGFDDVVGAVLRQQVERVRERCELLGVGNLSARFLWSATADHSRPMTPNGISQRFERTRKAAGLAGSGVRFYDLRHYGATQGFAAGIDVKTMTSHLRHSKSNLTLDRYADVLPASDRAATAAIAATLIDGNASTVETDTPLPHTEVTEPREST